MVSRAEQLADEETDVVAGAVGATRSDEMDSSIAPPSKRSRRTHEHRRKIKSSPPEICEKQSKQPRLSSYFVISSREQVHQRFRRRAPVPAAQHALVKRGKGSLGKKQRDSPAK